MEKATEEKGAVDGWFLSDTFIDKCKKDGTKDSPQSFIKICLESDLKLIGKKCIPDLSNVQSVQGPMVLQVRKVLDIGRPKNSTEEDGPNRLLKLFLYDGFVMCTGFEQSRIKGLSINTAPGTKIRLKGNVEVVNRLLLLNSGNTEILGGKVASLWGKWHADKIAKKTARAGLTGLEGCPPAFVSFADQKHAPVNPARTSNAKTDDVKKNGGKGNFQSKQSSLQTKSDDITEKLSNVALVESSTKMTLEKDNVVSAAGKYSNKMSARGGRSGEYGRRNQVQTSSSSQEYKNSRKQQSLVGSVDRDSSISLSHSSSNSNNLHHTEPPLKMQSDVKNPNASPRIEGRQMDEGNKIKGNEASTNLGKSSNTHSTVYSRKETSNEDNRVNKSNEFPERNMRNKSDFRVNSSTQRKNERVMNENNRKWTKSKANFQADEVSDSEFYASYFEKPSTLDSSQSGESRRYSQRRNERQNSLRKGRSVIDNYSKDGNLQIHVSSSNLYHGESYGDEKAFKSSKDIDCNRYADVERRGMYSASGGRSFSRGRGRSDFPKGRQFIMVGNGGNDETSSSAKGLKEQQYSQDVSVSEERPQYHNDPEEKERGHTSNYLPASTQVQSHPPIVLNPAAPDWNSIKLAKSKNDPSNETSYCQYPSPYYANSQSFYYVNNYQQPPPAPPPHSVSTPVTYICYQHPQASYNANIAGYYSRDALQSHPYSDQVLHFQNQDSNFQNFVGNHFYTNNVLEQDPSCSYHGAVFSRNGKGRYT